MNKQETNPNDNGQSEETVTFDGSTSQLLAIQRWVGGDDGYRAPGIGTRDILGNANLPVLDSDGKFISYNIQRGDVIRKYGKHQASIERPPTKE